MCKGKLWMLSQHRKRSSPFQQQYEYALPRYPPLYYIRRWSNENFNRKKKFTLPLHHLIIFANETHHIERSMRIERGSNLKAVKWRYVTRRTRVRNQRWPCMFDVSISIRYKYLKSVEIKFSMVSNCDRAFVMYCHCIEQKTSNLKRQINQRLILMY